MLESYSHITSMGTLGISENSDDAPLLLSDLTVLDLDYSCVDDLTMLTGMTGLTYLNLTSTSVWDLTPLAGMTRMTELDLDSTDVDDLTPLAGMAMITELDLSHTHTINQSQTHMDTQEKC